MAWTEPNRTWSVGETLTAANFNQYIRDQFAATWHLIARKSGDETVTSSTTFQPDNDLLQAVAANEVWRMHWDFIVDAATAGDMKLQWTFPGGTLHFTSLNYLDSGLATTQSFGLATASPSATITLGGNGAGVPRLFQFETLYINGGGAGTLQLEWAQNTSSGTGTVMKTHSAVYGMKLA